MTLRLTVPAKVNLYLEVGAKRRDGFHDLATILHTVGLHDTLELSAAPRLTFRSTGLRVPGGRRNLVMRAAEALRADSGCAQGAAIRLTKRIPTGAGLGGGSADAAAALIGLKRLWKLRIPHGALLRIASSLGSDVPFFLHGGAAIATGRGERLRPIPSKLDGGAVILKPAFGMPTADAYAALDRATDDRTACRATTIGGVERAVRTGDFDSLYTHNDFEALVFARHPSLRFHRARLLVGGGHPVVLAGSGSSLVGLCRSLSAAKTVKRGLPKLPGCTLFAVPLRPETITIETRRAG